MNVIHHLVTCFTPELYHQSLFPSIDPSFLEGIEHLDTFVNRYT